MGAYLDNAATSWPKPDSVISAVTECMIKFCGNPGRSGHEISLRAAKTIHNCRIKVAELIGGDNPLGVIFTKNATEALNIAIKGLVFAAFIFDSSGEFRIISTGMEHNAVARTMECVSELYPGKIKINYCQALRDGSIDPERVRKYIALYKPHLVISTLASNVNGVVAPVKEMGEAAQEYGAYFLVDAAQGAGYLDIDVDEMHIDMLAFSGHKGLLGPQGTGGLYVGRRITESDRNLMKPLICGGTGSVSEYLSQPDDYPGGFESGTLNTPGLAGLSAAIDYINVAGIDNIRKHKQKLGALLAEKLMDADMGITLHTPVDNPDNLLSGIVAFNLPGYDSSEAANILSKNYGISVRGGLHCAPMAHMSLGTLETGVVRVSFGSFNTEEDVEFLLCALKEIVGK